ncbi:hypothetical protein EXIGLDRAFT_749334 [Exidia glandulosa HHB12029]|uniref:Uncharacterized protein n=1 Tax=Exidia glandulosa HHB12029 TaxID=1314781 RepID=A0A165I9G4_EXIGL|nr:hypothetical protein EXIGLDRAFT_749334 [Exidia glandulosa HHB12029]
MYPKSDMDIYVFPLDAEVVGHWLIARGYQFVPWSADTPEKTFEKALAEMDPLIESVTPAAARERELYGIPNVRDVFTFKKRLHEGDQDPLQVQIVVSDITPVQAVLGFHATMVMNFITWDRVVSLYPAGTFEHRRALVTYNLAKHFDSAMIKYAARGFRIDSTLFDDKTTRGSFKFGTRWVGDSHCWVVKLDTAGLTPPAVPVQWEVNSWDLGYHVDHNPVETFGACAIKSSPIRSIIFRHRYCVTNGFFDYLLQVMKTQGNYEFERMQAMELAPGVGPAYGQAKPEGFC